MNFYTADILFNIIEKDVYDDLLRCACCDLLINLWINVEFKKILLPYHIRIWKHIKGEHGKTEIFSTANANTERYSPFLLKFVNQYL
jgi:hypothetical protein